MSSMAAPSLSRGSSLGAGKRRGAANSIASRHVESRSKVSALASKTKQIAPFVPAASFLAPIRSAGAVHSSAAPVRALPPQQSSQNDNESVSILWLKHDLRVDDHAGLARVLSCSSSSSHLLPLYVLDGAALPETCPGPCGAAALVGALESLRASLRVRGSDLVVVRARENETAADAVAQVAKLLKASSVVAESEVSPQWREQLQRVQRALLSQEGEEEEASSKTELVEWSASLHGKEAEAREGDWRKHAKSRGPRLAPIDAPGALPPLPKGFAAAVGIDGSGRIPSAEEVLEIVAAAASASASASTSEAPAPPPLNGGVLPYGSPQSSNDVAAAQVYSGGESTARAALAAYVAGGTLSSSSSAGPAAASAATLELAAAVAAAADEADVPGAVGSSFAALFAASLSLGTISTRRVAADAASALSRLPLLPALSVPRASSRARAALAAAEASDFHRSQALSRAGSAAKGGGEIRHWRWRGVLAEYVLVKPENGTTPSKGNILLIHGFGAFGEHYRDASAALASMGYTVYAPTLPGYGRSEKPAARYGQGLWGAFVSEFASCVVKGPVIAAGNSIGGYIVAAAAASAGPELFKGVVLLNPAGRVDGIATGQETGGGAPVQQQAANDDEEAASSQPPPSRLFVEAVSRALFLYLELSIAKTLKKLYPSNPDAADEWLAGEIGRAAKDPGALAVFQSVFYMPKPRALDVLLVKEFGGPCLLLQGAKDPLNDARGRAQALEKAVPGIEVQLLDAGHCPHDEVPREVAKAVAAFAAKCFSGNDSSSSSSSSTSSPPASSSSATGGAVVSRPAALV